jgi:hypothetical protein
VFTPFTILTNITYNLLLTFNVAIPAILRTICYSSSNLSSFTFTLEPFTFQQAPGPSLSHIATPILTSGTHFHFFSHWFLLFLFFSCQRICDADSTDIVECGSHGGSESECKEPGGRGRSGVGIGGNGIDGLDIIVNNSRRCRQKTQAEGGLPWDLRRR